MADKDTPIYDKTRMRGTTWVDATRILFNMGSELEEQVDGTSIDQVKQDLAVEIINRQNADTQLGNRITAEQTAREQADSQLQTGVNQNKSDITQIKETINQIEDNATALGASVAVIQTDVAENKGNIQANAGKIEVLENEYAGFNSEQISLRTDLTEVQADVEGIKTSLVSDVITKAGSTVGTIIVELEREDGTKISAQDFNYGKPTSMELLQGSSEGMMKAQFTLSDGTTVQSNDFQVLEQITGDVYITSFTFKNGSSQGKISAVIGLSDGRTLNANDFQLPTDPQIQSNITDLLSRMNAVEEKNNQQDTNISALSTRMDTAESNIAGNDADIAQLKSEDETIKGDITSLDERVTAIEDTPGVGKFELGKLGTIMGSSDDGKIGANPDGTGSVNGWDSLASADDLSDLQEQVSGIKPTVTVNDSVSPPTISVAVNGTKSTANLPSITGNTIEIIKIDRPKIAPIYFNVTAMEHGAVQALYVEEDSAYIYNTVVGSVDGDNLINIFNNATGGEYFVCGFTNISYNYSSDVNIPKELIISNFKQIIMNIKTGTYTIRFGIVDESKTMVITDKITINVTMNDNIPNCTIPATSVKIYSNGNISGNTRTKMLPQSITYMR